jgi:type II secretory pathway component GspD/PulD (secretin)
MKNIETRFSSFLMIFLVHLASLSSHIHFSYAADQNHYSEETIISLNFKDKSLDQVLKEISWLTGYSFAINKEYADLKVSGSLKDVPLHRGLKEILGKRSHTITYEPNKTVTLAIYKSSPSSPTIQNANKLSSPFNYMIGPENMGELNTEIVNPDLKNDIFDQNKEVFIIEGDHDYEKVQGMVFEENNESNLNFIPKKKSGLSKPNDINSDILLEKDNYDNDFKEYNEYNDPQDYDETLPVEGDQNSEDTPQ